MFVWVIFLDCNISVLYTVSVLCDQENSEDKVSFRFIL